MDYSTSSFCSLQSSRVSVRQNVSPCQFTVTHAIWDYCYCVTADYSSNPCPDRRRTAWPGSVQTCTKRPSREEVLEFRSAIIAITGPPRPTFRRARPGHMVQGACTGSLGAYNAIPGSVEWYTHLFTLRRFHRRTPVGRARGRPGDFFKSGTRESQRKIESDWISHQF